MDHALWQTIGLSQEGLDKLRLYAALVEKWTKHINLISKSTVSQIWERHIEDSANILPLAPEGVRLWADFGAGAGFPGLVVAVAMQDLGRDTEVVLVESDQRKATFLRQAAREMAVPVRVEAERIEKLAPLGADLISARALAALDQLCAISERHGAEGGLALFPKGQIWQEEVALAQKTWSFDLVPHEIPRHKGTAILELRNICRVGRPDLA